MSKYKALWEYVQKNGKESFQLTFEEIQNIAGISIDHSFLKYKKELTDYGYQVGKISMKEQTVSVFAVPLWIFGNRSLNSAVIQCLPRTILFRILRFGNICTGRFRGIRSMEPFCFPPTF